MSDTEHRMKPDNLTLKTTLGIKQQGSLLPCLLMDLIEHLAGHYWKQVSQVDRLLGLANKKLSEKYDQQAI